MSVAETATNSSGGNSGRTRKPGRDPNKPKRPGPSSDSSRSSVNNDASSEEGDEFRISASYGAGDLLAGISGSRDHFAGYSQELNIDDVESFAAPRRTSYVDPVTKVFSGKEDYGKTLQKLRLEASGKKLSQASETAAKSPKSGDTNPTDTVPAPFKGKTKVVQTKAASGKAGSSKVIQSSSRLLPQGSSVKGKGVVENVRRELRNPLASNAPTIRQGVIDFYDDDSNDSAESVEEAGLNGAFPRELRDRIYEMVLDHEYLQYTPGKKGVRSKGPHSRCYDAVGGRAHTYDFRTASLLAVDPATSREAQEHLLKHNTFVVIEFDMTYAVFESALHLADVPVVSDRLENGFPHPCVKLQLKWFPQAEPSGVWHDGKPVGSRRKGSFVMMVDDLHIFCAFLRHMCQYNLPPGVYITSERGTEPTFQKIKKDQDSPLQLRVEVLGPPLRKDIKETVVNALQTITGGGYHLAIKNLHDTNDENKKLWVEMAQHMAPPLIWIRALFWDNLDSLLQMKDSLDKLAKAGDHLAALDRCIFLDNQSTNFRWGKYDSPWEKRGLRLDNARDIDRDVIDRRRQFLTFDLGMTYTALTIILGHKAGHSPESATLLSDDTMQSLPPRMQAQYAHMQLLDSMYKYWKIYNLKTIREDVEMFIEEMANNIPHLQYDDYILSDVTILKDELAKIDKGATPPKVHFLLKKLSFFHHEYPTWNSQPQCDLVKMSGKTLEWEEEREVWRRELKDWQDVENIRTMGPKWKKAILKAQKENKVLQRTFKGPSSNAGLQ